MSQPPELIVAILAAGASRRLGHAKQLVPIDGEPLLRRQCRMALAAGVGDVVVILGFNADQHRLVIHDLPLEIRVNGNWAQGLSSTLRCAARAAQLRRAALLVLPCDQYQVTEDDLRALRDRWQCAPSTACVTRALECAGPPAILPTSCHEHLLALRGDVGARAVLHRAGSHAPQEVDNPRACFDVDFPHDVRVAAAWSEWRSA